MNNKLSVLLESDYYDLQSDLVSHGLITVTSSGLSTPTPSLSGSYVSVISDSINILNYTSGSYYLIVASGTTTRSGDTITWTTPEFINDYTINVYSVTPGYVLSSAGTWNKTVTCGFPSWSGNLVYVGSGRTYTTINAGIAAASIGDIVVIDPGSYNENVIIDKHVHLKGNTTNVDINPITITSIGDNQPIEVVLTDADSYYNNDKTLCIEGINTISYNTWGAGIGFIGVTASNLRIVVHRCYLNYGDRSVYAFRDWSNVGTYTMLEIKNCYLNNGYSTSVYTTKHGISITKCESNSAYTGYLSSVTPYPLEIVTVPTHGYGYNYGNWYLPIS